VGHPDRDWTDGCIALNNPEMQNLWNRVDVGTAVLVMP
jgi:lipoprotein-anchoring transpeptidase ErfK/SrfK